MFEQARRENFGLLIALSGMSGSGKTLSALKLARGIAGDKGKIAIIDTENGRSKVYANDIASGFLVAPFEPPYNAAKFITAIDEAEKNKIDVLIIDSLSHEWEGIGGVIDQAENATKVYNGKKVPDNSIQKWKAPKRAHQSLVDKLLSANMHIIVTLRAKTKTKQVKNEQTGKMEIISTDEAVPIQEKSFIYDASLHLLMLGHGSYEVKKVLHQELMPLFDGKPMDYSHGQALADFANGGIKADKRKKEITAQAKAAANKGMKELQDYWKSLSKAEQKDFKTMLDNDWKPLAEAIEKQKEAEAAELNEATNKEENTDEDLF